MSNARWKRPFHARAKGTGPRCARLRAKATVNHEDCAVHQGAQRQMPGIVGRKEGKEGRKEGMRGPTGIVGDLVKGELLVPELY